MAGFSISNSKASLEVLQQPMDVLILEISPLIFNASQNPESRLMSFPYSYGDDIKAKDMVASIYAFQADVETAAIEMRDSGSST